MKRLQNGMNGTIQVKLESADDIELALKSLFDKDHNSEAYFKLNTDKFFERVKHIIDGTACWILEDYLPSNLKGKPNATEYRQIYKDYQQYDNTTECYCEGCDMKGIFSQFDVHHILPKISFPNKINDPDNMILICRQCHTKIHKAAMNINR